MQESQTLNYFNASEFPDTPSASIADWYAPNNSSIKQQKNGQCKVLLSIDEETTLTWPA